MVTYRTTILFVLLLFGIGAIGYGYISSEYITNKGPDDFWTNSYVAAYLREKYGEPNGQGMRIRITDFKPDEPRGKKGLYTISCTYKGNDVTIETYYNGGKWYNWKDFPSNSK
jgi:hypothetical protein